MFDIEKYIVLTSLVRQARLADQAAFKKQQEAIEDWKAANAVLSERMKVLDGYIAQAKSEDISVEADGFVRVGEGR